MTNARADVGSYLSLSALRALKATSTLCLRVTRQLQDAQTSGRARQTCYDMHVLRVVQRSRSRSGQRKKDTYSSRTLTF